MYIGELPINQKNCAVFLEEEERSACDGLSSLVAVTESAEKAEDTCTDYQYDVPEDFNFSRC